MLEKKRKTVVESTRTNRRPATTIETRENQLIAKAMTLVERRIEEGTATSQEVCHFLKLGTSRAKTEHELLKAELNLTNQRIVNMESEQAMVGMLDQVLAAMTRYGGVDEDFHSDDEV